MERGREWVFRALKEWRGVRSGRVAQEEDFQEFRWKQKKQQSDEFETESETRTGCNGCDPLERPIVVVKSL